MRIRSEELMRQSEEKYHTIFEESFDVLYITSPAGKIVDMNKKGISIFGYNTKEELFRLDLATNIYANPKDRQRILTMVNSQGSAEYEVDVKKKNGEIMNTRCSLVAVRDSSGEISSYRGILRDITKDKQTEEALHKSEKDLKEAQRIGRLGSWDWDIATDTITWSDEYYRIFGLDSTQRPPGYEEHLKLYTPESAARLDAAVKKSMQTGEGYQLDLEWVYVDGTSHWIVANGETKRDDKGQIVGFQGTAHDITGRKRADATLKILNAELTKSIAEKDKFFSIIAHDLRSPFQGFIGLTEKMSEDISSFSADELVTLTHVMSQSAQNLYNLLQNLLEWSQFKKGSMSFTPQLLSLSKIVSKCIGQINQRMIQKGITTINEVPGNQEVFVDERMLNSILGNLHSNAIKFTPRNGTVTISSKKTEDQMIEISIKDTGIGIPKSMIEKLFEPLEKTGRKGTDGELSTGLGLLLCKEFVEKNKGKIWVKSEEGRGSTFYFTLASSKQ